MAVYMVRAGGKVKIGFARDAQHRTRDLQTGHYETLEVLRVIEGGRQTERWLHSRFAEHRLRGEWFNYHPAMLDVVPPHESEPAPRRPKEKPEPAPWAAEWRKYLADGERVPGFLERLAEHRRVHGLTSVAECMAAVPVNTT